jgi:catechol 2,3-dioxygenase-like lactoylglutathione lyase family enzyme
VTKCLTILLECLLITAPLPAQGPAQRPPILGISHAAYFVSDLPKTLAFYTDFLGFAEPYDLKRPDGTVRIAFIKINDYQHIELFAEPPKDDGMLSHVSIYTDNAAQMRQYLASRNVKVPSQVGKGRTGDKNFNIKDPDGHTVEIVEYEPDGWAMKGRGTLMPPTRISDHVMHVGILVGSLEDSMKFYGGILGFKEFWRGRASGKTLSWVDMRIPDGQDYIEFMLYRNLPPQDKRGGQNHFSLVTPDIAKSVSTLESRPAFKIYGKQIEVKVGHNRQRQANIFDPDGTRIELMEPFTVDGKPTPQSTARPPR